MKHQLQFFSLLDLPTDVTKLDGNIEKLVFRSGGDSFLITDKSKTAKPSLYFYVNILDAFRTIGRKTLPDSTALVSNMDNYCNSNIIISVIVI